MLLLVSVALAATAVWVAAATQRSVARHSLSESQSAQRMLTAMLDQETGVRGYALTGREAFLAPYLSGIQDFEAGLADLRKATQGDRVLHAAIATEVGAARQWQSRTARSASRSGSSWP